jgi:hypothetical protein
VICDIGVAANARARPWHVCTKTQAREAAHKPNERGSRLFHNHFCRLALPR